MALNCQLFVPDSLRPFSPTRSYLVICSVCGLGIVYHRARDTHRSSSAAPTDSPLLESSRSTATTINPLDVLAPNNKCRAMAGIPRYGAALSSSPVQTGHVQKLMWPWPKEAGRAGLLHGYDGATKIRRKEAPPISGLDWLEPKRMPAQWPLKQSYGAATHDTKVLHFKQ